MKSALRPATGLLVLLSLAPSVLAVPSITSTKDDATAAATRKVAGDNIDYTIQISNAAGATDATGVTLTDPTPANTTLVPASVNVSPLAFDDAYVAVGNTTLRVGNPAATTGPSTSAATKVIANDTEFLGDTFTISTFQATSANGGTVAMVTTGVDAGSFSYLPPAGFEGVDTFTYTITDDGSTGFPALTGTGTVTITVSEVVWYVDDSAAGGGTGRSNAPLQSLASLNVTATDPDEADDYIFVYSGNYSGVAFTLEAGQRLIGEPAGLTVAGLTIAAGGTRPAFSHNAGTLLTLAAGNTVRSINFTNTAGNGISGSAVGTLTLSDFDVTTTGGTALSLTTSGTVTAIGTDNDLSATTGTALNVANVTILAGGMTFKSIAASGGSNGIVLNNTGALGGLTVTGDAGSTNNSSGGVIQTCTASGIALTSAQNVSFDQMNIHNITRSGINGTSVTNFTFTNGTVNTCGTQNRDSCIAFNTTNFAGAQTQTGSNITGTLTITGSTLSGGFLAGLDIDCDNGTLTNANVSNNTVPNASATAGTAAISFVGTGNASTSFSLLNATINQNTVTNAGAAGIQVSISNGNAGGPGATAGVPGDGTKVVSITNNSVSLVGASGTNAIIVANSGANSASRTRTNFVVTGNGRTAGLGGTAPGALGSSNIGTVILIGNNGFSTMTGTVDNNVITASHTPNFGGGNGIAGGNGVGGAGTAWTPQLTLTASNNVITGTDGNGILLVNRATNGEADLKINNNNVAAPNNPTGSTRQGIRIDAGNNTAGEDAAVFLNIFGNTSAGSNGGSGIGIRKQGSVSTTNDFGIYDAAGGPSLAASPTNTDITNFISALNPGSATGSPDLFGTGGTNIVSGSNFLRDTTKAPPLLFAPDVGPVAAQLVDEPVVTLTQPPAPREKIPTVVADKGLLQLSDLDPLLSAAIARWEASGLTGEQLNRMQRMTFTVEEMPGLYLGKAEGDRITLDANAAGNRWFIDRTPGEDSEFSGSGTRLAATANGGAAGRVDALTTIVHELGHAVGLDDSYLAADRDSIMYGFLHLSERRLPRSGQAEGAKVHNHSGKAHTHYLASPITIGTLPPGKTVTVVQRVTVNAGIVAPSVSNQGTVSGSNFADVLTDDPNASGAANATVTVIEVPPVVSNVARTTAEDTVLTFTAANFTGAYTDANLDPLATVRITSLPTNGTLKLVAANVTLNQDIPAASLGNLSYTPAQDYNGTDSFNWNASDGTLFAVTGAAVNLTITEVNDPVTAGLDPQPAIAEDAAPLVIAAATLAANDVKGPANESTQTLTVISVGTPVGGTVVLNAGNVTFTPTPDFNGAASFQYTVQDNGTTNGVNDFKSAIGQANFTITEVNDAPVAVDDALATVAEDAVPVVVTAASLLANDTKGAANESAQTLTVTTVGNPIGGTVALNAGNVTFTLTPNYNGPASFEYTVQDNGTTSGAANPKTDIGLVSFTITSVNDNPVAAGDTIQRYPTQTVKVSKAALLANDTDPDGGTPAFVSVAAASANGGTVTSDATTIYYTPAANFTAADNFTYTINDGQGGTANGTVTVAIITDNAEGMSVAKMETLGDGSKRVTFGGIPGRSYRVQTTENLTVWTTRLTITADAQGRFQFIDPPPLPPTRFYRSVQP